MSEEAVELTLAEAALLAKRLVARHITTVTDWPMWEDYPNLSERAFVRLCDAVTAVGTELFAAVLRHEQASGMDTAYLLERAQA